MAKTKITDYSTTRSSNSDIDGINIAENCPAGNMNDAFREGMVQLAETNAGTYPVADTWSFADPADLTKITRLDAGSLPTATSHAINAAWLQRKGADIASATTTDLSTATGGYVDITGTTTITGLGTVAAGVMFVLQFDGILTFTHNGTSLILPGAANITTAAGDVAVIVSEGSGNWRCVSYQRAASTPLRPQSWELISETIVSSATDYTATGLSAFKKLRLTGHLIPATDGVALSLRTSTNNGSSYDSGASDYSWYRIYGVADTAASDGDTADSEIDIGITGSIGNTDEGTHFEMTIINFNKAQAARVLCTSGSLTTTGAYSVGTVCGARASSTARDALAMFFSSGNIASGSVTLEGIRG